MTVPTSLLAVDRKLSLFASAVSSALNKLRAEIIQIIAQGGVLDFSWTALQGKPTVFPPAAHTHPVADIVGFDDHVKALFQTTDGGAGPVNAANVVGFDERVRDVAGALITAGLGVGVTNDDPGDKLTIALSGAPTNLISTLQATLADLSSRVGLLEGAGPDPGGGGGGGGIPGTPGTGLLAGYSLVFQDSFDAISLRTRLGGGIANNYNRTYGSGTWTTSNTFAQSNSLGGSYDGEFQFNYDQMAPEKPGGYAGPISVAGGEMTIKLEPTPASVVGTLPNHILKNATTGAGTDSGQEFQFVSGYASLVDSVWINGTYAILVDAFYPAGMALWPITWTYAKEGGPTEMDVDEEQGEFPTRSNSVGHGGYKTNDPSADFGNFIDRGLGNLTGAYRKRLLMVSPEKIQIYIFGTDGVTANLVVEKLAPAPEYYKSFQYFIANLGLARWAGRPNWTGPDGTTPMPAFLKLRDVQIWGKPGAFKYGGDAFVLTGDTSWVHPSVLGTPTGVHIDFVNRRAYAKGALRTFETCAIDRPDIYNNGYEGNYQLLGPGAAIPQAPSGTVLVQTSGAPITGDRSLISTDYCLSYLATNTDNTLYATTTGGDIAADLPAGTWAGAVWSGHTKGASGTRICANGGAVTSSANPPPSYVGDLVNAGVSSFGDRDVGPTALKQIIFIPSADRIAAAALQALTVP